MVSLSDLKLTLSDRLSIEYQCQANLNLYDSPTLTSLATQAIAGRQLRILSLSSPVADDSAVIGSAGVATSATSVQDQAVQVSLAEDDYPGWLPQEDLDLIEVAEVPYQPIALTPAQIRDRLPQVIAYAHAARSQPNHYLWGGTVGPNYDCSGLMQTAFLAAGIWLPRDAYQQAAFTQSIALEALQPGDLLFFGSAERINHVGLYLGDGHYIHSSGKDQGHNGIAIDLLAEQSDPIAQAYYRQLQAAGRVVTSYQPLKTA